MFGKMEHYDDDYIEYKESVHMILGDLKCRGFNDLTIEKLNNVLQDNFSIGRAVRNALIDSLALEFKGVAK